VKFAKEMGKFLFFTYEAAKIMQILSLGAKQNGKEHV